MSYFSASKSITIVTEAGPSGLSAIFLEHTLGKDDYHVNAYSSRALRETEQRCSQLEKECLSILHGFENFSIYLIGCHFDVLTDHKPLVSLLTNPKSTIPLRIERWCLRLHGYNFTIRHIKGTLNLADYCSRHTSTDADSVASIVTDECINFVLNHATPIAVTLQDIQSHTRSVSNSSSAIRTDKNGKMVFVRYISAQLFALQLRRT